MELRWSSVTPTLSRCAFSAPPDAGRIMADLQALSQPCTPAISALMRAERSHATLCVRCRVGGAQLLLTCIPSTLCARRPLAGECGFSLRRTGERLRESHHEDSDVARARVVCCIHAHVDPRNRTRHRTPTRRRSARSCRASSRQCRTTYVFSLVRFISCFSLPTEPVF